MEARLRLKIFTLPGIEIGTAASAKQRLTHRVTEASANRRDNPNLQWVNCGHFLHNLILEYTRAIFRWMTFDYSPFSNGLSVTSGQQEDSNDRLRA